MGIRKTKRNRRTRKNKASSRKRIHGGGLFDFFFGKKPTPETGVVPTPPLQLMNTEINSANNVTTAQNKIFNFSRKATTKADNTIATTDSLATVAKVGYTGVVGLTATGIGIPLAGALAGALLIASKLAIMYINNKKLFPIMFDSMTILSNGYKLHELIESAYKKFQTKLQGIMPNERSIIKEIKIDSEILSHISTKVTEVTAYLLKIADKKVLKTISHDQDIINSKFDKLITQELESREKTGLLSSIYKKIDNTERKLYRLLYASEYKADISENLSLINGFFIIIKSQFDFALELYEQELDPILWKEILQEIHASEEYKKYMIPVNVTETAKEIVNEEKAEIGDAVLNEIKIDIDEVTKQEINGTNANTEDS